MFLSSSMWHDLGVSLYLSLSHDCFDYFHVQTLSRHSIDKKKKDSRQTCDTVFF